MFVSKSRVDELELDIKRLDRFVGKQFYSLTGELNHMHFVNRVLREELNLLLSHLNLEVQREHVKEHEKVKIFEKKGKE